MTNDFVIKATSKLLFVSVVLALFHFYLIENILPDVYGSGAYWAIYIFLIPISMITIFVAHAKFKKDKTAVGKVYLVFVFIKIFGSITFLAFWIFPKTEFTTPFVHQFFCLFFPLLFVETMLLVKLLNSPSAENLKNDENH